MPLEIIVFVALMMFVLTRRSYGSIQLPTNTVKNTLLEKYGPK